MGLNEVTAGMTPQEKKSISHTWKETQGRSREDSAGERANKSV